MFGIAGPIAGEQVQGRYYLGRPNSTSVLPETFAWDGESVRIRDYGGAGFR